jgi:hypothetical protein
MGSARGEMVVRRLHECWTSRDHCKGGGKTCVLGTLSASINCMTAKKRTENMQRIWRQSPDGKAVAMGGDVNERSRQ